MDYSSSLSEDIRGLRVGIPKNYFNELIENNTANLYAEALNNLEKLGAILIEVDIPFTSSDLACSLSIGMAEAGFVHEQFLAESIDLYGRDVKASLELTQSISSLDYIKALKRKEEVFQKFEALFTKIDIIATPTTPDTTKKIGETKFEINGIMDSTFNSMVRLPAVFNFTGQPALSLPCGIAPNGLPVGLQLASSAFNERTLLRAGYAYEQAYLTTFYKERESRIEQTLKTKGSSRSKRGEL